MKLNRISLLVTLLTISLLAGASYSANKVMIEYFYMSFPPNCPECVDPNVSRVNDVIREIERDYGEQVIIQWFDIS
jgi:hypothetical protein